MPPPIRIVKFWTAYPVRQGKPVAVDMVEYCAPGAAQRSTTTAVVASLGKIRADIDMDNPVYRLAVDRWEAIRPAYEAWKQGQELPEVGTPIGAWPGITVEQAEVFRNFGFRSVEDIAEATDSVLTRVQLPGVRDIQENARRYLASADQMAVARSLEAKDAEIAEMRDQMEELRQMLVASMANSETDLEADGSEAPKRRGRPPKIRDEDAA